MFLQDWLDTWSTLHRNLCQGCCHLTSYRSYQALVADASYQDRVSLGSAQPTSLEKMG
jgi:hypothetical protein